MIKMHPDTESTFWMILRELESACGEKCDNGRKQVVEAGYRHWNAAHKKQVYPEWIEKQAVKIAKILRSKQ